MKSRNEFMSKKGTPKGTGEINFILWGGEVCVYVPLKMRVMD